MNAGIADAVRVDRLINAIALFGLSIFASEIELSADIDIDTTESMSGLRHTREQSDGEEDASN
jgi:hypothetical protein